MNTPSTVDPRVLVRVTRIALVVAALGFAGLAVGMVVSPVRAMTNLLVGGFIAISLAVGAMGLIALLTVANAGWAAVCKRVMEGFGAFVPVGAVLILTILPGIHSLYEWSRPEAAHDPLLHNKAAYLNVPFFAIRMVVILAVWTLFTTRLRRLSIAQDTGADADVVLAARNARWSAAFVAVLAITFCLAGFDWFMTLEARWFSTIFGLYHIAGMLVSTVSAVTVATVLLRRAGLLPMVRTDHLHDLGKLMFGFCTFWAYLWFSQLLLIWYSNIPEETAYYAARFEHGWTPVFVGNVVVNFVVPFLLLLPQWAKRNDRALLIVGTILLLGRWLDLFLMAAPSNFVSAPIPGLLELAGILGPVGLLVFWTTRTWQRVPLRATRDPYWEESVHLHT
jgi:hypothetical protein